MVSAFNRFDKPFVEKWISCGLVIEKDNAIGNPTSADSVIRKSLEAGLGSAAEIVSHSAVQIVSNSTMQSPPSLSRNLDEIL